MSCERLYVLARVYETQRLLWDEDEARLEGLTPGGDAYRKVEEDFHRRGELLTILERKIQELYGDDMSLDFREAKIRLYD